MKLQEQVESKQNRLFVTVVCLVLMLALYFAISWITHRNKPQWQSAVGELNERDFAVAVSSIRTQAKLKGRVSQVQVNGRWVQVNNKGQPQVNLPNGQLDCAAIWLQVMGLPLNAPSYELSGQMVQANGESFCRYQTAQGDAFDYHP